MKQIAVLFLGFIFLLSSCAIEAEKQCTVDADCVPAQCCHATDAVNKQSAPDCRNVLCTLQCEPGTLDCGQGEVKCRQNKCAVEIK